nr:hypothetical protein [Tanacetum cinerariifolium]
MSVDSVVTYTSVHSEARSWSIPSEDPYEEAAQQLLEQAPRSPEYVPDLIELEDHVPAQIPEHPEDLVPVKDEAPIEAYIPKVESAPTPPLPPSFLSPRIRPPHTRAAMAQMRAAVPSTYHSLLPSGTPPLLPIPLPVPSTSHKAEIPKADMPPQKRLLFTAPRPGCEVGESYVAAAARQPGPTMARSVDCSFVDTIETRFRDTERRMMTALEMVNIRKKMAPKRATRSIADQETTNTASVTNAQLQAMIDQGVTAALAARDALRSTNGDDSHNSGTGARRTERATRECTFTDFLKCQPLHFKGTEEVSSLSQWFERMETVFHISNYTAENQVKFATCTLHSIALTWWNTHVQTVGHDAAYGMLWKTLMKMMTDNYCPRNEIKKLEMEIWDMKVKGGLPDMIHGSVVASKPKTMQEAVAIATELMDQKIRTFAEREIASKRKFKNTSRSTQNQQQQPNKRQNTGRVYTAASGESNEYAGTLPLCNKCKFHHNGQCTIKCTNCKRVGHLTRDCRSPTATNNHRNPTCYECGNQGHYRSDCPELKNHDHGNQAGGTGAHGMLSNQGVVEISSELL